MGNIQTLLCQKQKFNSSSPQNSIGEKADHGDKFALPESVEEVKEIEKVIKNLRNRVRGKYEEVAHC